MIAPTLDDKALAVVLGWLDKPLLSWVSWACVVVANAGTMQRLIASRLLQYELLM
jgi:hypothetical protein